VIDNATRGLPAVKAKLAAAVAGLFLCAAVLPGRADAQDIRRLGTFDHWSAYAYTEDGNKVCYMASQPEKDEGDYERRGEIYAMVTHRPAKGTQDVVSFVIGYPFKQDSRVKVTVDGEKTFTLFTHKDTAWAPDSQTDDALVQAMIQGGTMVVDGTSDKGTETTDTYSLIGFTDAHNAIDEACNIN